MGLIEHHDEHYWVDDDIVTEDRFRTGALFDAMFEFGGEKPGSSGDVGVRYAFPGASQRPLRQVCSVVRVSDSPRGCFRRPRR
jgi:hypothetical protein